MPPGLDFLCQRCRKIAFKGASTLYAMVRIASDMLIINCLNFASFVLASKNSSSESPTCSMVEVAVRSWH